MDAWVEGWWPREFDIAFSNRIGTRFFKRFRDCRTPGYLGVHERHNHNEIDQYKLTITKNKSMKDHLEALITKAA